MWKYQPDPKVTDRFWRWVDKREPDECWPWMGHTNKGYGRFRLSGRKMNASRAAMFIEGHDIPSGMPVDHTCHNRICCNPRHLRIVTVAINNLENSVGISALNRAKTHCVRGHPLSGSNLRVKNNHRRCVQCLKIYRTKQRDWRSKAAVWLRNYTKLGECDLRDAAARLAQILVTDASNKG